MVYDLPSRLCRTLDNLQLEVVKLRAFAAHTTKRDEAAEFFDIADRLEQTIVDIRRAAAERFASEAR